MARIRTIKPEFWTDGDVVHMTPWARLFFIGTWNFTMCDQGHLLDDPVRLKMQILPADDVDPYALIEELVQHGRLTRLQDGEGRRYLHVKRFTDHQKLEKRWTPRCSACNAEDLWEPPAETSPKLARVSESLGEHAETPRTSTELPEPLPRTGQEGRGQDRTGQVPPPAGDVVAAPTSAQSLLAEWIDACGTRPPGSVVGQVAKQLGGMLTEGIPFDDVRGGLALWHAKRLHPSTLPSVVHEFRQGPAPVIVGGSARKREGDRILEEAMWRAQAAERNAS